MSQFLCRDLHSELSTFFPSNEKPASVRKAKQICSKCLGRQRCLEAAIKRREEWGIFGGMTFSERCDYSIRCAIEESKDRSLQQSKLRDIMHPLYVFPVSQEHIPSDRNHSQQVLSTVPVKLNVYRVTLSKFL